jgi:preprotein translocase subunit SecY
MHALVAKQGAGLLGLFNMFSGGALGNLSVFALGIMPYVSASIILQLLTMVVPALDEIRKEGESGQRRINQLTRYATIGLSIAQGLGISLSLEAMSSGEADGLAVGDIVSHPGWGFRFITVATLTAGTSLIMWMGEQITERGIGNGTSLIIFAGIVTDIPTSVFRYFETRKGDIQPLNLAAICAVLLSAVSCIILFERAQRRIPIFYARRTVGKRVYGGQNAHLPLRVNTAGTIPPIFASSLLMFPATLANFKVPGMLKLQGILQRGDWVFDITYFFLILFFCYFYTAVTFQAVDVADNLKKQQAFIPSVRQGRQTAEYIDYVLTRITLGGALYVATVCIAPSVVGQMLRVPFQWGGTSLMIVVGVALDTVGQIQAQALSRKYDGMASGRARQGRLSGRVEA